MPGQIVLNVLLLLTVLRMDRSETGHGARPAVDVNVWVRTCIIVSCLPLASAARPCPVPASGRTKRANMAAVCVRPRMPIDPTQDATTPRFSADCSRAHKSWVPSRTRPGRHRDNGGHGKKKKERWNMDRWSKPWQALYIRNSFLSLC